MHYFNRTQLLRKKYFLKICKNLIFFFEKKPKNFLKIKIGIIIFLAHIGSFYSLNLFFFSNNLIF